MTRKASCDRHNGDAGRRIQASRRCRPSRPGATSPVIVTLLSLILLSLVGLIVVVLNGRNPPSGSRETAGDRPKIRPVNDPDRIKETLKQGRTYRGILKVGFSARAEDEDWGQRRVTSLVYAGETVINRTIEANNGKRLVELRYFEVCRNVKILADVEDLQIDLGAPGSILLGAVTAIRPEVGVAVGVAAKFAKPIAEGVLKTASAAALQEHANKTYAFVDKLSGKKVRITYVDGVGVESVVPVDCELSEQERNFLLATAVVSDCHLMDLKIKPGGHWTVDALELAGFIDPTLRSIPTGEIGIQREPDIELNGINVAVLRVIDGVVTLEESDSSTQTVGRFVPKGTLRYNLADNYIQYGNLQGTFNVEQVSTNHILFKASFRAQPIMQVHYSCQLK
jgi:hypothetical protein